SISSLFSRSRAKPQENSTENEKLNRKSEKTTNGKSSAKKRASKGGPLKSNFYTDKNSGPMKLTDHPRYETIRSFLDGENQNPHDFASLVKGLEFGRQGYMLPNSVKKELASCTAGAGALDEAWQILHRYEEEMKSDVENTSLTDQDYDLVAGLRFLDDRLAEKVFELNFQ